MAYFLSEQQQWILLTDEEITEQGEHLGIRGGWPRNDADQESSSGIDLHKRDRGHKHETVAVFTFEHGFICEDMHGMRECLRHSEPPLQSITDVQTRVPAFADNQEITFTGNSLMHKKAHRMISACLMGLTSKRSSTSNVLYDPKLIDK